MPVIIDKQLALVWKRVERPAKGRERELILSAHNNCALSYLARSDDREIALEMYCSGPDKQNEARIAIKRAASHSCDALYRFYQLTETFVQPEPEDKAWLFDFYRERE
ncbi:MAG: hypothetical protein UY48_C0008G0012 [Candidatus Gottesmanbacteria bacterium GW2011_GWB1_49_7]|uniref:Uncharacterized protein n=1 Tax=Candidatus Gottesmanbacteria bacterium GW2011_GWB1_49_7 TaxID=1618448 RepID=A0A0G1YD01_9BACT|nr:MAG: hypothetical protein UY48_C0008G0012 [Candidatus Gottesmanbacteria bacterium GW2011_GWB1_49_7]